MNSAPHNPRQPPESTSRQKDPKDSRGSKDSGRSKEEGPSPKPGHPLFDWRPLFFTLFLFSLYYTFSSQGDGGPKNIPYTQFKQQLYNDEVASVLVRGQQISGRLRNSDKTQGYDFVTQKPTLQDDSLLPTIERLNVELVAKSEELPTWASVLINLLPWILIFGFFAYSNRALQSRMGGGGGLFGFSRSHARLFENPEQDGVTFDEVAGLDSAKQDLREVIEFLRNPEKYRKLGAKLPKGILMMGPPGTGKTLLARATAAEAGVPFFSISGSEFVEMFVGVGAGRVRSMFEQAREKAPALIFVDEIDSVGRVRGSGVGGGNDEREQTLNQILAEMDGFSGDEPIVVLAATNRPDVLDPALMRPGRFDRKITMELPQKKARLQILQVHTRNKPVAGDVDLEQLSSRTIGFSGADLENLVNEAALHAARLNQAEIRHSDFEYAHDKILLGSERQDILNTEDKKRIAYHESGHALLSMALPHADPVSKVTIIPRGRALGVTETMPVEDRVNYTQAVLEDRLCVLLGGRCAERVVFGNVSSGAADDLKQCTLLARRMVTQWGMSETLGPVHFPQHEEHPFLGMEIAAPKDFSDATAHSIDLEVEALVKKSEERTLNLLRDKRAQLDALAAALMDHETVSAEEIERLIESC
ncbi:ATP-dependent zinc metalloprotease FtsH [Ketobacter sp.]|uniref:ATP-dependent zinc metalloprotease FtsH n=1 Tax=Ketobacter sp. TaxID=2083498 RepID=UPI000F25A624|nr:ATP-dependent zinc metalloprotease FtsH [Ketobacter sp.]RLT98102.1 MAG: ATP-dependent metallopeptidase FtsH/Yme1/Tma family protein [Ketobacter sp.]